MRKSVFALLALLATALAAATVAFASSGTQEDPLGPGDHIDICHTGNGTNYVFISPSASSGGPAGHEQHAGDIFAGYYFQQNQNADVVHVEGQNEDQLALLETDCESENEPDLVEVCDPETGDVIEVPEDEADEYLPADDPACMEVPPPDAVEVCDPVSGEIIEVSEEVAGSFPGVDDPACNPRGTPDPPDNPGGDPPTVTPDAPPVTTSGEVPFTL